MFNKDNLFFVADPTWRVGDESYFYHFSPSNKMNPWWTLGFCCCHDSFGLIWPILCWRWLIKQSFIANILCNWKNCSYCFNIQDYHVTTGHTTGCRKCGRQTSKSSHVETNLMTVKSIKLLSIFEYIFKLSSQHVALKCNSKRISLLTKDEPNKKRMIDELIFIDPRQEKWSVTAAEEKIHRINELNLLLTHNNFTIVHFDATSVIGENHRLISPSSDGLSVSVSAPSRLSCLLVNKRREEGKGKRVGGKKEETI